jgi:hypothetical protein
MKKVALCLLLALVAQGVSAQKEKFLRTCVSTNAQAPQMEEISEHVDERFSFNQWVKELNSRCDYTIKKKFSGHLVNITEQEKVVDALLALAALCPDNPELKRIQPDLKYMKDVYRGVDVETEVIEADEDKNEDPLGALFGDDTATTVTVKIKQVRKLRRASGTIMRKLKIK